MASMWWGKHTLEESDTQKVVCRVTAPVCVRLKEVKSAVTWRSLPSVTYLR